MSTAIQQFNPSFTRNIVSKKDAGKVTGRQYLFGSTPETPTELRARLKDTGLKGNKLSNAVREIQKGNLSASFVQAQAFVEFMRSRGCYVVGGRETARGGSLEFKQIAGSKKAEPSEAEIKAKALADIKAKLIALGLSEEDIAAL